MLYILEIKTMFNSFEGIYSPPIVDESVVEAVFYAGLPSSSRSLPCRDFCVGANFRDARLAGWAGCRIRFRKNCSERNRDTGMWSFHPYIIEQEHEDCRSALSFSPPSRVWSRKITGTPENARKHVKTGYPRLFSE